MGISVYVRQLASCSGSVLYFPPKTKKSVSLASHQSRLAQNKADQHSAEQTGMKQNRPTRNRVEQGCLARKGSDPRATCFHSHAVSQLR